MQSLERFLDILESVAPAERGMTAAEVAKAVDLPIATVSRLMHVLTDYGLLHRPDGAREYVLGPRLFTLVGSATTRLDLGTVARPYLERLRDASEETSSAHIRRGRHRVCLVEVPSRHQVRRVVQVGSAEPLGGGATGAVLLSSTDGDERQEILRSLPMSGAERGRFRQMVEHAQAHGWAINVGEWVSGLCGISAGIRKDGVVVAALSVSGPLSRFTRERALSQVETLMASADEIGLQLEGRSITV